MPIIEVQGLTKTYRVFQKQPGLVGALRGLGPGPRGGLRVPAQPDRRAGEHRGMRGVQGR